MIKAIFFDLDDTLLWDSKSIEESFKETCGYANKVANVNPIELEEKVREEARKLYSSYDTYEFTKNIGINPFKGLWGDFSDEFPKEFGKMKEIVPSYRKQAWSRGLQSLGIDNSALGEELSERFRQERKKRPYVFEHTFHVLDSLKENYTLLLLTNGSPHLQNTKLEITPELVPYFKEIIISGNIGKGKPDSAMFLHALDRVSLRKEEVLMVGDNLLTDILGASNLGIKTVWVNHHNQKTVDIVPDFEVKELSEILTVLEKLN